MNESFPTVQLAVKPGVIDLRWGQPDPRLLPVTDMQDATQRALARYGSAPLMYGADAGAGPLLDWLAERIAGSEGRGVSPREITITAGNSDALDQVCTLFTAPGDVVLVEDYTYHLAVRIMRDHHLELIPIPTDAEGIRVNALQERLAELKQMGRSPRFLYVIPTFHNPTGKSLSESRRRGLVKVAAAEHLLLVEDDVYRELAYDSPAPPSLWSIAPEVVLRMGSFAKSLAPGLRLGWLTGKAEFIQRIVSSGLRDSGGGVNHFTAMMVGEFCEQGYFDRQVDHLRRAYRARRDALAEALGERLPDANFSLPGGGFFIWVTLPPGVDAARLHADAEAAGVDFIPGTRFSLEGRGNNIIRLAFTLYEPPQLQEGVHKLAGALERYEMLPAGRN